MRKLPSVILLPHEEKELSRRWKTTSDQKARDRLIFSCTGYVQAIANKRCRKNEQLYRELVQEGYLGLLQAVEKYDPHFPNRFATYALWWIRAYINRYMKCLPRESSLDQPIGDDTDTTFKDAILDECSGQERLLGLDTEGDVQLLQQVATTILHGNEWEVMRLRYFSGDDVVALEEVGHHIMGRSGKSITREAVRIIEHRAITKLRDGLARWEETLHTTRSATHRASSFNPSHHTEVFVGKIPEKVILACIERISGKDKYVSAIEVAAEISKEEKYVGIATPFLVGQSIKYMVKAGLLTKRQLGSKRAYRVKDASNALPPVETPSPTSLSNATHSSSTPLAHTHEDRIFQVAIAMLKLGDGPSTDAVLLSGGLRELSIALQKIPDKYRERAIQIAKKIINK